MTVKRNKYYIRYEERHPSTSKRILMVCAWIRFYEVVLDGLFQRKISNGNVTIHIAMSTLPKLDSFFKVRGDAFDCPSLRLLGIVSRE